ncbi:MAG: heme lyase CcmF/NrfE family subunit [Thermincola sp.]|jgi:cytochrome c-type biogenesis protein CcmF|nr:heme lyase CcmF/NrfE family subunit [Thermincola sp.]MDT3703848.1 heme lyase CcmF/NrfE family subunit [Thermincola sp.]
MADIGYIAVVIAFVLSIYAIVGQLVGKRLENKKLVKSARGAVLAIAIMATVASMALIYLLVTSDFSIKYVNDYTSTDLPLFYKVSALWAGNAGSLLLWLWVLTLYAAVVTYSDKIKELTAYVSAILTANAAFFLFILAFVTNPFEKLNYTPAEGAGMNPMLQNPGMVAHPVTTYLGYVGFAVPFAFAMAALIIRNNDDRWIKVTRKWTILAWMFLTLGNLYGAQWAYVELGWGGYWAWDPVENASFIPWLTGSAFLHSVMVQERKNLLKIWNVSLVTLTYLLTLFGTFLVRSGILTSVHAFGNSSLGMFFLAFTGVAFILSFWLICDRINVLKESREFESFISKESSFLMNNLILVGIAFTTFFGTIYPLIGEVFTGTRPTVSIPYFNRVNAPLGVLMVVLIGICPLIAWRKSSLKNLRDNFLVPITASFLLAAAAYALGIRKIYALVAFTAVFFAMFSTLTEFFKGTKVRMKMTGENPFTALGKLMVRNRRRYGGYIIHMGLIMLIAGIIGSNAFAKVNQQTVSRGQSIQVENYTLTYNYLAERRDGSNDVVYADVTVFKDGKPLGSLQPEKVFYSTHPEPSSEVAIQGSLREDLYIILAGWEKDGRATLKVLINPLVAWLWIGGYVMVVGTIFALWPGRGAEVGPKIASRNSGGEIGGSYQK